jgi:hypothetical protein
MISSVFSAVAGVISEPVKGAKKGGMKGMSVGIGKGILGLVCKPMKGTIDLVTKTTRGISNTPKTMYIGISKLAKKKKARKEKKNPNEPGVGEESKEEEYSFDIDPNDDILIGEENGENVYISKTALREKLHNS